MNETPDFKFTASSAQLYQWVAENDPAMLEEIKKRVSEGRWNIVGGWWVEPDVNIPSGESMVRQGLYGQLTFGKLFGKKATVAFNPDSLAIRHPAPDNKASGAWKTTSSCGRDPMKKHSCRDVLVGKS
jgi:alpha-mannosidase